jgi:Holliday junction resolvase RusA-like endonuclease
MSQMTIFETEPDEATGQSPAPAIVIRFEVIGEPKPQGSKIAQVIYRKSEGRKPQPVLTKNGRVLTVARDDNAKTAEWRQEVATAARRAYQGPLLTGAVRLTLVFSRPRLKGHFGKRGLLASAPTFPTTRPDTVKLTRAVEDSLTGVIWRDDSQVVDHVLSKRFGSHFVVAVTVESLDGKTEPEGQE